MLFQWSWLFPCVALLLIVHLWTLSSLSRLRCTTKMKSQLYTSHWTLCLCLQSWEHECSFTSYCYFNDISAERIIHRLYRGRVSECDFIQFLLLLLLYQHWCGGFRIQYIQDTVCTVTKHCLLTKLSVQILHPAFPGEFGSQWLACDLSLRRRPGCDQGSCHQCGSGDYGEGGQGLPQTGAGEPNGRVEVLHLLWVFGVPVVGLTEVGLWELVFWP